MAKFVAPNLANATPAMIADEIGKLSLIENHSKKLRKVYREALFARLGFDATKSMSAQPDISTTASGDTFILNITQHDTDRFDLESFKADHPDMAAKYYKTSMITTVRPSLKEGVVNPVVSDLLKAIEAELDLVSKESPAE